MNPVEPPAAPAPPAPGRQRRGHHVSGFRAAGLWLLGFIVRAWCRTMKLDATDTERNMKFRCTGPCIAILWHNRLFVAPWLVSRLWSGRRMAALVSASRDGAVFSKFLDNVGLTSVRGSSSRFGREALNDLVAAHRSGLDVALTPDGPRGPVYEIKGGALTAARRTGAHVLLVGIHYSSCWRLRSWDGFMIPRPFGTVTVRFRLCEPAEIPPGDEGAASLRSMLLELSGETGERPPSSGTRRGSRR